MRSGHKEHYVDKSLRTGSWLSSRTTRVGAEHERRSNPQCWRIDVSMAVRLEGFLASKISQAESRLGNPMYRSIGRARRPFILHPNSDLPRPTQTTKHNTTSARICPAWHRATIHQISRLYRRYLQRLVRTSSRRLAMSRSRLGRESRSTSPRHRSSRTRSPRRHRANGHPRRRTNMFSPTTLILQYVVLLLLAPFLSLFSRSGVS